MYIYTHIYLVSKTVDKDKNYLPCPARIPMKSLLSLGQPLESLTPQIHQSKRMTGQARERAGGRGVDKSKGGRKERRIEKEKHEIHMLGSGDNNYRCYKEAF